MVATPASTSHPPTASPSLAAGAALGSACRAGDSLPISVPAVTYATIVAPEAATSLPVAGAASSPHPTLAPPIPSSGSARRVHAPSHNRYAPLAVDYALDATDCPDEALSSPG